MARFPGVLIRTWGRVINGFADKNGNEWIEQGATASAVNHLKIVNAAADTSPAIVVTGASTNPGLELQTMGTGWLLQRGVTATAANGREAFHRAVTTKTNDGGNTMTAAEMRGGIWEHSGMGTAQSDTTAVADDIIADIVGCQVGTSFDMILANTDNDQVLTIVGGSGVTLKGDATIAAGNNACCRFVVTAIGGTSDAITGYMHGGAS